MLKILLLLFVTNNTSFATETKSGLETKMEHFQEKGESNDLKSVGVEGLAIFLKTAAFGFELGGMEIAALPGLYLAFGTAYGSYRIENAALNYEQVAQRFKAAVKTFQDFPDKEKASEFEKILDDSNWRTCKDHCKPIMGRKNANNLREISWCVLNCPNIILQDYMCEVLGNMRTKITNKRFQPTSITGRLDDTMNIRKTFLSKANRFQDYLGSEELLEKLSRFFSDPFVKTYRENLKGRMMNRYFQGEFFVSLAGRMDRFTTIAHKMDNADFWSADSNPNPMSLIDLFRTTSPVIQDIRKCFGSLCYTNVAEYNYEIHHALTQNNYTSSWKRIMSGQKMPLTGIISLEDLKTKTTPPAEASIPSKDAPQDVPTATAEKAPVFPAPFDNYCTYYFARTPINMHSRLINLASFQKYRSYFNEKIQERYEIIKRSTKNIDTLIKRTDIVKVSQDYKQLESSLEKMGGFMKNFSAYVEARQKGPEELLKWKESNPEALSQISTIIFSMPASAKNQAFIEH